MSPRQQLAAAVRKTIEEATERVSLSAAMPDEGALTIVDDGRTRRQAKLRQGVWVRPNGKPLGIEPTHWLRFRRNG